MKFLVLMSLFIGSAFAQNITFDQFKKLALANQTILETYSKGMAFSETSTLNIPIDDQGTICSVKSLTKHVLINIVGDTLYKYEESKVLSATPSCGQVDRDLKKTVRMTEKETVESSLSSLEQLQNPKFTKNGDKVRIQGKLVIDQDGTQMEMPLDMLINLKLSLFFGIESMNAGVIDSRNTVIATINPRSLDLTQVYFCEQDQDESDCQFGDFTHVLDLE